MAAAITLAATAALMGLLLLAAISDVRTRRIPNLLTGAGVLLALALRAPLGIHPLLIGLAGAALAFLIALPLFALGGFGGGDAKLVVMVGAFLGPGDLIFALLFTAVAGGVLALVEMTRRGAILPTLYNLGSFCTYCVTFGQSGSRPVLGKAESLSIPYGVPIALGTLAVLFLPFKEWML